MADVMRVAFLHHLRAAPTTHIRYLKRGKLVRNGVGISFWFRPLTAALSELPVDDRELPLLFHGRTCDFQDVTVQATVTYRIVNPDLAASRVNFGIHPDTGKWQASPLEQLGGLLTESAQQHALEVLAGKTLTEALTDGIAAIRQQVNDGLRADERLAATGIEVVGVRVVAVRAEPDVDRALQTPTREQVQQAADKATYQRRATAVQQERAIAENELENQIELARREELLVAQRGQNARREAEEQAAASNIVTIAESERQRLLAGSNADAIRLVGAAESEVDTARLIPYRDLDPTILLGLAVKELAGHIPDIGTLNITPDILTPFLSKLGGVNLGETSQK